MEDRKCPLCREKIPPSKEMLAQLKFWRKRKSDLEAEGNVYSEEYMTVKSEIEKLERAIGDCAETLDYSENNFVALPKGMRRAAKMNDIQKVIDWLGPPPVDKQRINARDPDFMNLTLLDIAVTHNHSNLISILLQFGADVDPVDAAGMTPLGQFGDKPEYYAQARLLLEWGAEISNCPHYKSKDEFIQEALEEDNSKLANLLTSESGGRRCEIINLPNHPDLIGKTCVVEKYLPDKGRYKVIFEMSKEVGLVGPENLARRDRTPDDCGYYISYENGRTTRRDFASKEECQAFQASLAEEDSKAEARAEQAAASLLAELSIESSTDVRNKKKGKQKGKGKKKGRK